MVPEGWKKGVIEDIANVSSGGTPSRKKDSYWSGNIPWVTTAEVKYGVIKDTEQKITEEGLKNSSAKLFPKNTILMAMYGQGKTRGQVAKLGIEASTNQACAALLLKSGFNVDYYYQYLVGQYENIRELANSGGQQNLSSGIIKGIHVPIPPLSEQQKIARILSTWDKAIANTEKRIDNSKQQKKALMQQLLTGKKRFPGFEGEWEKLSLRSIVTITYGKSPKEIFSEHGRFNVIGTGGVTGRTGEVLCSEPAVVIGRKGTIDKPQYIDQPFWAIDTTFYCTPAGNNLWIKWFYYLCKTLNLRKYNEASGVPSLSRETLYSIKLKLPTIEEQQKIATVLTNAGREIELLEQQLADLKQEKKALMQQLLTGKRRVLV